MSSQKKFTPYNIVEHEVAESLHITAFGEMVPNTLTFAPDEIEEARQYCDVLNAAYNAGVAGKGANNVSDDKDPGYNTLTRNGS